MISPCIFTIYRSNNLNNSYSLIMSKSRRCYLQSLNSNRQIHLLHMVPFTLGRNIETGIQDTLISKKQIVCYSDTIRNELKLKPVGQALSGCNGLALKKGLVYTIGHDDVIEILMGHHKFKVVFDVDSEEPPEAKKPKMYYTLFNTQKDNKQPSSESNHSGVWEEIDNRELLIFTPNNCKEQSKIASFDIDGTIIKTKSGATFPKNADDWTWNIPDIKDHLRKLYENDFKLVFFTNQSGVGKDLAKIKEFKRKIVNIITALNLPIYIFVSLGKKNYRKPRTGMWDIFVKEKNENSKIDFDNSFYVGDAAGREKDWAPKRKKDHSAADRLFALNIGLRFYTPEEYFLKQSPAPFKMPEFDPRADTSNLSYPDLNYNKLNVVIMVGGPGSGKSSFVKSELIPMGYAHVNRDKLGSWQKCVNVMEEALENNKNVVIDNTNVDRETRQRFIQAAKKYNADVRCFIMNVSLAQMRHNNKFREMTDKHHMVVSDIIIFSFNKKYQEPERDEGYTQILKIPFIFNCHDKTLEKLYKTYILEQ